jgi:hypothetical protein
MTVLDAINEFYNRNNFGEDGGVSKKWIWFKFGFISIPLPNLESRSQNIYLHDINHIVSGYEANWQGESAIAGWEIASGGWGNAYFPWLLTLWAMGIGVVFYPKSTFQAFQKGLSMNNALTCKLSKQEMFSLPVNELKVKFQRTNLEKNNRNFILWASLSVFVWIFPLLLGLIYLNL